MRKILNFIQNSKIKAIIILLVLLLCYTFLCASSYVQAVSSDISNNILRLHVIANSNNKEDQDLKYKVRDKLLDYMNSLCVNISSKDEAILIVKEHKEEFKNIAIAVIKEEGFNYSVNINIGNFEFPTKTYGNIALPAGMYDALRIEIGNAAGQNWWCVMFPSLCFIDINSSIMEDNSKSLLENNLSDESYAIVSENSEPVIKFKFKILEIFGRKNVTTAKN